MGKQLCIRLWYPSLDVAQLMENIVNHAPALPESSPKAKLGYDLAYLVAADFIANRFILEMRKAGKEGAVLVGIVPAQIYDGYWGRAFHQSTDEKIKADQYIGSLVGVAGVCALYRAFANSIISEQATPNKVMLVHVHPIFYEEYHFQSTRISLLDLWTGKDGILSRVITMAKNQIAPFQEVHIGEAWDGTLPSILVDVGPKAITVG